MLGTEFLKWNKYQHWQGCAGCAYDIDIESAYKIYQYFNNTYLLLQIS